MRVQHRSARTYTCVAIPRHVYMLSACSHLLLCFPPYKRQLSSTQTSFAVFYETWDECSATGCSLSFFILSRYFYIHFPALPFPPLLSSFMIINSYVIIMLKLFLVFALAIQHSTWLSTVSLVSIRHRIKRTPLNSQKSKNLFSLLIYCK